MIVTTTRISISVKPASRDRSSTQLGLPADGPVSDVGIEFVAALIDVRTERVYRWNITQLQDC
jgi:hypothetical protein